MLHVVPRHIASLRTTPCPRNAVPQATAVPTDTIFMPSSSSPHATGRSSSVQYSQGLMGGTTGAGPRGVGTRQTASLRWQSRRQRTASGAKERARAHAASRCSWTAAPTPHVVPTQEENPGETCRPPATPPNKALQPTAYSLVSLRSDVGESPSRRTRT